MQRPSLEGRSILVVGDQPLLAMDISQAFEPTGAAITTTTTVNQALFLVEHKGLSGAILDHALGKGDSSLLCARLKERRIPFIIHSGGVACAGALQISKPAAEGALVAAMVGLILGGTPEHNAGPALREKSPKRKALL